MQQASCLEGGPLLWIWPLYLHVNQKFDDDDDDVSIHIMVYGYTSKISVLQLRRGKQDDLGIIFHITPLKLML